ncbi:MAG: tripartite tricarboxylate transporter TctB family protein [Ideonella sp.]|nr:tripartite tricarboxylate transporter TctB family protein [Ideonella sp.]MCC7459593.1 tripartite tricarboxylate transporter TctB family protein [Nitrospira sp.]
MLTGTPLDLTPYGGVLAALGWLYWLLALGIVVLALWWPKRWWVKLAAAAVVLGGVVYPVFVRPVHKRVQEQQQFKARLDAATARFEMRCKSAGEKIARAVEGVEGVVWLKWREPRDVQDDFDQYKLFDPYGRDCAGDECIAQLLRLENTQGRFQREVEIRKGRYRYVESIDPADGRRYRYTGTMKLMPAWTAEAIERFRRDRGTDPPESAYWFQLERKPIDQYTARYGITWDDLSTREDREQWIAGGSLKVIDLQSNGVIAERVGYMMDRGLGSRAGFRMPWAAAPDCACSPFPKVSDGGAFRSLRGQPFLLRVLMPTREQ